MTTTTLNRMQDERLAGGLALLLVITMTAIANFVGGGDGGAVPYLVCVALCAVVAAVLFGRVLPTTAEPARAAWILAALAIVTCVAFWSGLPFVFGAGAIYAASRAGRTAPAALGGLAVIIALIACLIG